MTKTTSASPLPEPASRRGPATSVQAAGVAFDVLEALADAGAPVGTSELARRLGQTKARVHRHLATLRALGFVEQDGSSSAYQLGWRAYRLSLAIDENFGLRRLARPHLLQLQRDTGQTVALAAPAGLDIAVVDAIQSEGAVAITVRAGSVIQAASSALGRAILAFQTEAERAAALARPTRALTPSTTRDPRALEGLLAQVRTHWYAVASNERLPGVAALAAPVFDARGQVVASVGLIGSQALVTELPPPKLVAAVQQAAAAVSGELRSQAWTAPNAPQHPRPGKARRRGAAHA